MNLVITEAKREDVDGLCNRLRDIDMLEVSSLGGTAKEALLEGFDGGMIFTAKDKKDNVVCMFGSADAEVGDAGVVWMLGSELVDTYKKDVLKLTKKFVEIISKPYKEVYNYIHEKNKKSIRWLKWCGFDVDCSRTYQFGGENFYYFKKDLSHV